MDTQDPVSQLFGKKHSIKMRNNIVRTCKRNGVDPVVVTAEAIKTLTDLLEVLKLEAEVPARTTGKKLGRPRTVDALRNHFDYSAAKRALELADKAPNLSHDEQARAAWVRGLLLIPQSQLPTESWTQADINVLAEWNILPERFLKY